MMKNYAKQIYEATLAAECTDLIGGAVDSPVQEVVDTFRMISASGGKVIMAGNGGSLAACSHMANDLCLAGVTAMALDSPANMSCIGNDLSFAEIFSRQVRWFASLGDVVVLLSCSGKSADILIAAERVRIQKCALITLSGFKPDNPLRKLGEINFYVPSSSYGVVQLAQEAILHCIIDKVADAR